MIKYAKSVLFVAAALLLFAPFFALPNILFPDLLGKATVIQVIIAITLPALVVILLPERKFFFSRNTLLPLALFAYTGLLMLTSFTGIDPYQSFWGSENRSLGVFNYLHYFAAFFIFLYVLREERWRKRYLRFAVAVGAVVAFSAIFEFINTGGSRALVFLGNPILLGAYLIFPLFISLILAFNTSGRVRFFYFIASGLTALALLFSQTRGAFLGVIAGAIVGLAYYFLAGGWKNKKAMTAIILIFCSVTALVAVFYFSGNVYVKTLVSRFSSFSLSGSSANQRVIMYRMALQASKEHFLLGWGPENFDYAFDKKYDPALLEFGVSETWSDRSHNIYLDALVMGGISGLLAYLAVFAAAFLTIFRSVKTGARGKNEGIILVSLLIAYAAQNFFAFDSPTSLLCFMFVLAYIAAPVCIPPGPLGDKKRYSSFFLILGFVLGILALVPTVKNAQAAKHMLSASYLPAASAAERLKEYEKAFSLRPKLIRDFRLRFANTTFEDAGAMPKDDAKILLTRAIEEMQKNVKEAPEDFAYRYELGNLFLERGMLFDPADFVLADESYSAAESFSPKRQALFFQLASVKYLRKDLGAGIILLQRAVNFNPEIGQSHWRLGIAYAYNGEQAKALAELREAITGGREVSYFFKNGNIEIPTYNGKSLLNFVPTLIKERQFVSNLALHEGDYGLLRLMTILSISFDATAESYGKLAAVELELGNYDAARAAVGELLKLDSGAASEAKIFLDEVSRREQSVTK